MAKKITCKPAPEIEIEYGGETILLRFDLLAVMELQDLGEDITDVFSDNIPEMAAKVIYSAAKNCNKDFDMEKARRLVICMSVDNITEIINEFAEALGTEKRALDEEYTKNLVAQFLAKKCK